MSILFDLVSLIVAPQTTTTNNSINSNPIDPVGFASMAIGIGIFAVLGVLIAHKSYKLRKETEKRIAEWHKIEERHRQQTMDLSGHDTTEDVRKIHQNA